MAGALIEAAIDAEADRVFKEAWKDGRRESRANYRFDALQRLITRAWGAGDGASSVAKRQVVIRVDAARLVGGEGICTTQAGPVPVDEAVKAIIEGAAVTALVKTGVDITKVTMAGRYISASLKAALLEREGWKCAHCGSRHSLELHHIKPYSEGGPTSYDNLVVVCSFCHDLISNEGYAIRGSPGAFEWVAPAQAERARC
jgi:hypothetical protein